MEVFRVATDDIGFTLGIFLYLDTRCYGIDRLDDISWS